MLFCLKRNIKNLWNVHLHPFFRALLRNAICLMGNILHFSFISFILVFFFFRCSSFRVWSLFYSLVKFQSMNSIEVDANFFFKLTLQFPWNWQTLLSLTKLKLDGKLYKYSDRQHFFFFASAHPTSHSILHLNRIKLHVPHFLNSILFCLYRFFWAVVFFLNILLLLSSSRDDELFVTSH